MYVPKPSYETCSQATNPEGDWSSDILDFESYVLCKMATNFAKEFLLLCELINIVYALLLALLDTWSIQNHMRKLDLFFLCFGIRE